MGEYDNLMTYMTIELKQHHCIRIRSSCYRLLGEPEYIQLLVNPVEMTVAVRAVDLPTSKDSIHKVNRTRLKQGSSQEIYSTSFLRKLCKVVGGLDEGHSYKLTGKLVPKERLVVFDLQSITLIDR